MRRRIVCFALLSALMPGLPRPASGADELRAGVAVVDVTPPVPYRMSGYFNERLSTGVKDPLHAKAIVLEQGDQRAALVFCDLVGMSHRVTTLAREEASLKTGIPVEHIAITATHSHTGPLYYDALRNYLHRRSIQRTGADPYEITDYPARLVSKIVAAIVDAQKVLEPVELAAGYARQDGLAFNRRYHMRDGSVRFNPGHLNPDIVRPAGPTDPQVGIVAPRKPGADKPWAALASFAMHLDTVGGTKYSADYPKPAEDKVREAFGPKFTLLFGTGTCGDINHIDVTAKRDPTTEEIGGKLGDTVVHCASRQRIGAGRRTKAGGAPRRCRRAAATLFEGRSGRRPQEHEPSGHEPIAVS